MPIGIRILALSALLAAVLLLGAGVWYGGVWLMNAVVASGRESVALVVFGAIVLLLAARIIANGPVRAEKTVAEEARRRRVAQIFRRMMEVDPEAPDFRKRIAIERRLMIDSSPSVLRAWIEYVEEVQPPGVGFLKLIRAVRKDLGRGSFEIDELALDQAIDRLESGSEKLAPPRQEARSQRGTRRYQK